MLEENVPKVNIRKNKTGEKCGQEIKQNQLPNKFYDKFKSRAVEFPLHIIYSILLYLI